MYRRLFPRRGFHCYLRSRRCSHPSDAVRFGVHLGVACLLAIGVGSGIAFAAEPQPQSVLTQFDQPLPIQYLSWMNKTQLDDGHLVVRDVDNRGGVGYLIEQDLSKFAESSLAIRVKVGPANRSAAIVVMLKDDQDRGGRWEFPLGDVPVGDPQFSTVFPRQGASLRTPNASEKNGVPDLANIRQVHVLGDWVGPTAVDVEVDAIWIASPTAAVLAARTELARLQTQQQQQVQRQQQSLIERYAPGGKDSPNVVHIAAAAPDIIAIDIQAGTLVPGELIPYTARSGDKQIEKKADDGGIESIILQRDDESIGWLIGPDRQWLTRWETVIGDPLLEFVGDQPNLFQIKSSDDPNYSSSTPPAAVHRKSRANGWAQGSGALTHRHTYYLRLPTTLQPGKHYSVDFGKLNTRNSSIEFQFDVTKLRSDSVHVNQIGYRPDDPQKRAFVSCWLGSGGRLVLPDNFRFAVVNEVDGSIAFRGLGECHFPATKDEQQARTANFNGTDVGRCDFSDFQTPGTYRIVVENVGCSYPFVIGDDTWRNAFLVQMRGLYHQRSGVELGPPHTTFQKPRDMHPADGYQVTRTDYRTVEAGDTQWQRFIDGDTGQAVPGAAGGYHDAGDWNPRRVTHMRATMATLAILELFGEPVASLDLNIPPTAGIPDILTEALFEFEFFQRLQEHGGGLGYGVESGGDPRPGEVSWLNSFVSYVPKSDYAASWYYAAVGARLARVLKPYDKQRAGGILASAIHAFEFAETDHAADVAAGKIKGRENHWQHIDFRNLAALELYQTTSDENYHAIFLQDTVLADTTPTLFDHGTHVQIDHAFAYARLPDSLGDENLKLKATAALQQLAETMLVNADGNAFNVTMPNQSKPQFLGYYTVADASALVYAHALTGQTKYLAGIVQATQFQSGCNPNNWVYTTGLGSNPVKNALKLDARFTGQPVPAGLTPYGNADLNVWNQTYITWPITWIVGKTMHPNTYEWPTTEAYWDLGGWPMLEEFTVDLWADNLLVWGYLAHRR